LITQESLYTTYKIGCHSHLYKSPCIITFHHHHLPPSSPSTIITFHHHHLPPSSPSTIITFHHHHLPPSSPSTIITFHHHLTLTLTTRDTFEMEIAIKYDASLPDSYDRNEIPSP
jgi:hypothetical protein